MKNAILTILLITIFSIIIPFETVLNYNLNPLIFGIALSISNHKLFKKKFLIGFVLTITCCYLSFFVGFFGLLGIIKIVDWLTNTFDLKSFDGNILILTSGLIASLTLYLFLTKVYTKQNIRRGLLIMLASYILIPFSIFIIPKTIDFFVIYNLSWLLIVGFFLTFTLNYNRKLELNN